MSQQHTFLTNISMQEQLLGAYLYKEGATYPEGARVIRKEDIPGKTYFPGEGMCRFCMFIKDLLNVECDKENRINRLHYG